MIYQAYQAYSDLSHPVRGLAVLTALGMRAHPLAPLALPWWSSVAATWEMVARTRLTHERPSFGIDRVIAGGRDVAVSEESADRTPFAIGGQELLNCAVSIHLHEADLPERQLASRRLALELDRAADRASGAYIGGAERSGDVVWSSPVCVRWQRHTPNVPEAGPPLIRPMTP